MNYEDKWEVLEELGRGGQGIVFKVRPQAGVGRKHRLRTAIKHLAVRNEMGEDHRNEQLEVLLDELGAMLNQKQPSSQKALKVLHAGAEARDPEKATERLRREIEALENLDHPNVAPVVDSDPDGLWFVSDYYPLGGLDKNLSRFHGDVLECLTAFRSVVEAVAYVHSEGIVHRDIKPQNIFVDADDQLVLGDFGLVYFVDSEMSRMSETFENVGTHAWEPPWAFSVRVEDLRPSFDVFSLGKVLWHMISGKPVLQLWYFEKDENNVEVLYPYLEHIGLINPLLSHCIVQDEENCLPDAAALLDQVDNLIRIISNGTVPSSLGERRPCQVCGVGTYEYIVTWDTPQSKVKDFGLHPRAPREISIYNCDNCGHVQLFTSLGEIPPGWD